MVSSGSRRLDEVVAGGPSDVDVLLELARRHLEADVVFIGRFVDEGREYRNVAAAGQLRTLVGAIDPLDATYCGHIARTGDGLCLAVTDAHPIWALPITDQLGIRSFVGVPIATRDGGLYGTLCSLGTQNCSEFDATDHEFLKHLAALLTQRLLAEDEQEHYRGVDRSEVRLLLQGGQATSILQPIVALGSQEIVGHEALARFESPRGWGPDRWFQAADAIGMSATLDLAAFHGALGWLEHLPAPQSLSVNVNSSTLQHPQLLELLAQVDAQRVIIEVTEQIAIADPAATFRALRELRELGVRVAVDDYGAGHASPRRLLLLEPDFIKLDRGLIEGIDRSTAKQALVAGAVAFSDVTDARLVAEGIETFEELSCVAELGVDYGQGYLLARPRPNALGRLPERLSDMLRQAA